MILRKLFNYVTSRSQIRRFPLITRLYISSIDMEYEYLNNCKTSISRQSYSSKLNKFGSIHYNINKIRLV